MHKTPIPVLMAASIIALVLSPQLVKADAVWSQNTADLKLLIGKGFRRP